MKRRNLGSDGARVAVPTPLSTPGPSQPLIFDIHSTFSEEQEEGDRKPSEWRVFAWGRALSSLHSRFWGRLSEPGETRSALRLAGQAFAVAGAIGCLHFIKRQLLPAITVAGITQCLAILLLALQYLIGVCTASTSTRDAGTQTEEPLDSSSSGSSSNSSEGENDVVEHIKRYKEWKERNRQQRIRYAYDTEDELLTCDWGSSGTHLYYMDSALELWHAELKCRLADSVPCSE